MRGEREREGAILKWRIMVFLSAATQENPVCFYGNWHTSLHLRLWHTGGASVQEEREEEGEKEKKRPSRVEGYQEQMYCVINVCFSA